MDGVWGPKSEGVALIVRAINQLPRFHSRSKNYGEMKKSILLTHSVEDATGSHSLTSVVRCTQSGGKSSQVKSSQVGLAFNKTNVNRTGCTIQYMLIRKSSKTSK